MYPALAVLQASGCNAEQVLWVGGKGGMEADLVQRTGIPFQTIPAAGVHGVGLRTLPGNLWSLAKGFVAAKRILRQFRPDVLFFTGGYVAVPMALAGWRIPSVLYVPDIEPGLALKVLARFADTIAVTAEESRKFFSPRKTIAVTGYPTRPELSAEDRSSARQALGLSEDLPVLLVFGGSKGARSINRALLPLLPALLMQTQVVHISGTLDWDEVQQAQAALPADLLPHYHAFSYLHTEAMAQALASADLAVSRAGASTLGEYPLFGLPSVLVPYPYAWRYQKVNADYLVKQGAAVMIEDARLNEQLLNTVETLLGNPDRLNVMRSAARAQAHPLAARQIAALVEEAARKAVQRREVHHG